MRSASVYRKKVHKALFVCMERVREPVGDGAKRVLGFARSACEMWEAGVWCARGGWDVRPSFQGRRDGHCQQRADGNRPRRCRRLAMEPWREN